MNHRHTRNHEVFWATVPKRGNADEHHVKVFRKTGTLVFCAVTHSVAQHVANQLRAKEIVSA